MGSQTAIKMYEVDLRNMMSSEEIYKRIRTIYSHSCTLTQLKNSIILWDGVLMISVILFYFFEKGEK